MDMTILTDNKYAINALEPIICIARLIRDN